MRKRVIVFCGAASLLAAAALAQGTDSLSKKELQEVGRGRGFYLAYCANCHAADAHGAVTTRQHLAPDLTLIAARDGRFDPIHVAQQVGGRFRDCNTEMPCWVKVLRRGGRADGEGYADGRVFALVEYLRSIQPPPAASVAEP